MPPDYDNQLLREAIINIKAKDYGLARRYLERALLMADDRETRTWANYWMSQITDDPHEKRQYLEETLANDPTHPEARKALAVLDGKIKPDEIVNPEALPAQSTETQRAQADRFTCPKCGARMVFDGDGRTLICEHCARSQGLSNSAPEFEQDFILAMATVHIRPSVFCPCWRTRAHTPSQSLPSRPENAAILCLSTPRVNAGRQKIPSGPAPLPYALPRT